MSPTEGMDIYEARLASFNTTIPGTRRRASGAKGTKAISWPHKTLSPSQLANAGFYYKPSSTSPDNTVCFMCEARLDGWEEDDDPIVEHLTHSNNCPWALVISATLEDAEDPTTSKMMDARRETFAGKWPHETKRGWTCKIERMVEAGWHFAPTPDSDDFVTCAFCKLSLDGWEPKDNPFDEHHRRSPDCRFFHFAGTTAPKATRGKKGRASKASRASTQSVMSTASEHPSIPDFEDSIDQTTLSQDTVMSTASKAPSKGRKPTKGKGKGSKAKKAELIAIEDSSVIEPQEDTQPSGAGKGRKRTSEQISTDDQMRGERESTVRPEPPAKRRTTRSRTSTAQEVHYPNLASQSPMETEQPDVIPQPRATRKRTSSRSRKVSTASTASKASLRAAIPDDSAIEAELAAELEKPLSEDEDMPDAPEVSGIENKKGGKKAKDLASTALVRKIDAEEAESQDQVDVTNQEPGDDKGKKKGRPAKGKGKKKANAAAEEKLEEDEGLNGDHTGSQMIQDDVITNGPGDAPDHAENVEIIEEVKPKKGAKKKAAGRPKAQKQAPDVPAQNHQGDIDNEERTTSATGPISDPKSKQTGSKKQGGKTKDKAEAPQRSMPGAFDSQELSQAEDSILPAQSNDEAVEPRATINEAPALHPPREATPSPSPQSSDAENQPPSSRPSTRRPPLLPVSPSRTQGLRIPVVNTPKHSPSKLNRPIEGLVASRPWSSVDVEMIFVPSPGALGKENVFMNVDSSLSSPEKKMTVEQWISHLAHQTEDRLKNECERIVGVFEKEGSRAMMTLESIDCIE